MPWPRPTPCRDAPVTSTKGSIRRLVWGCVRTEQGKSQKAKVKSDGVDSPALPVLLVACPSRQTVSRDLTCLSLVPFVPWW